MRGQRQSAQNRHKIELMQDYHFSANFIWGTATSAYQIEGARAADGRGNSIWDAFCHLPDKVRHDASGEIACDHYHRWREDIALMQALGLQAYRFSIAWPRIFPQGRGALNPVGLDFYDRLVDGLLGAGIRPFVTLYHWDLPQALQDQGGWPARATAEAFVAYADAVSRRLGDRVKDWITFNEPATSAFIGHERGDHAPGWQNTAAAIRTAHHQLLAHGWSIPVLRQNSPAAQVGIALDCFPFEPASASAADYHAARLADGRHNRWFLDPLYGRHYPADVVAHYQAQGHWPQGMILPDDMQTIATQTDFLGINYYTRVIVRADIPESENLPQTNHYAPQFEWMDNGWGDNYPQGLYATLCRLHFEYQIPRLYITENGASYNDGPDETGHIHDWRRIAYLQMHIQAASRAVQAGIPLAGYFVWSLLDNFEWASGYTSRLGLVWVDFVTYQRLPKASALWYRDTIAAWRTHHQQVAEKAV